MSGLFRSILVFILLAVTLMGISQDRSRIIRLKTDLASRKADTASIRLALELSQEYTRTGTFDLDSALLYATKALELSGATGSGILLYEIRLQFARIMEFTGNYSMAMEYLFESLKQLDERQSGVQDTIKGMRDRLVLYGSIANDYMGLNNYDKALEYYHKSRLLCDALRNIMSPDEYSVKMQILLNNIGSAYLSDREPDSALVYLREAVRMNAGRKNPANLAAALNNIGIAFKDINQHDSSYRYYQEALGIREDLGDTRGIAQIYNNLGDYYIIRGNYPQAIRVLSDALDISRRTGSLPSQMKAANFLTEAYSGVGNYRAALEMQKLFKVLSDSIININNIKRATQLELQYQFDRMKREAELVQQQALARKERNTLIMALVAGILLLGIITLLLLYNLQRIKARRSKLELDFRNKELTTHVMYLLQKNEFILTVSKKLIEIKDKLETDDRKHLMEIVRELETNADRTVWEEFEVRFQNVHQDFYANLNKRFPDLTPNEKKICAFLRLNMTTKEISSITFQSNKSLLVARARLRKKMGIDRDENLVSFLQQF